MTEQPNPIQVQRHLAGVQYPAKREDLIRTAKESGADKTVLSALHSLPDQTYDAPTDVSRGLTDN